MVKIIRIKVPDKRPLKERLEDMRPFVAQALVHAKKTDSEYNRNEIISGLARMLAREIFCDG